jgi:hypothetical protein
MICYYIIKPKYAYLPVSAAVKGSQIGTIRNLDLVSPNLPVSVQRV